MQQDEAWNEDLIGYDSCGERLFVMFSNMALVEINILDGKLVHELDVAAMDGVELTEGEQPRAYAFAVFKDLGMLAVSTTHAVYLIDFEKGMRFN